MNSYDIITESRRYAHLYLFLLTKILFNKVLDQGGP